MLHKHFTLLYKMFYNRFEQGSSPGLFEFISVRVCHGPRCPNTGGTGLCTLQVRPQYGSVLFKFDSICLG